MQNADLSSGTLSTWIFVLDQMHEAAGDGQKESDEPGYCASAEDIDGQQRGG